ncbi:MAG TPA: hypothetical protein VNU97_07715 [Rhizomicrobium sp.]|jgi:hypothetical protein|nr:hypothetical protein [Rhizomicrobium sp.]
MQLPNVPGAAQFLAIEKALQKQRLARYAAVAGSEDLGELLKFYMWNCALCEAFYLPLQMAEIVTRNAIHGALLFWLKDRWFENQTFIGILDPKFRDELAGHVVTNGELPDAAHQICSSLSFGFWEHLTIKRFNRILWNKGIGHNFPQAPVKIDAREDLHALIEKVRRWRNRIAHHKPIYDRSPSDKYQDVLTLIRWVCNDTANWVASISRVQQVINAKPQAAQVAAVLAT